LLKSFLIEEAGTIQADFRLDETGTGLRPGAGFLFTACIQIFFRVRATGADPYR